MDITTVSEIRLCVPEVRVPHVNKHAVKSRNPLRMQVGGLVQENEETYNCFIEVFQFRVQIQIIERVARRLKIKKLNRH